MIFAAQHLMLNKAYILLTFAAILLQGDAYGQKMNNVSLGKILDSVTDSLEGREGMWQIMYSDRMMLVITDEQHDRMRIISPIDIMDHVSDADIEDAMTANFHSVLDVRYAISEEILWAAFIHPLKALSEEQVRDALLQVYRAAETFGSTFSSTELVFPGSDGSGKGRRGDRKKM